MTGGRRLLVLGGIVLAVLVALRIAGELTRDDERAQGPAGSSYAYGSYGASAYAALLLRSGREVIRLRDRPRDLDLDPRLTVVLLYPDVITPDDAAALGRFVRRRREARGRGRAARQLARSGRAGSAALELGRARCDAGAGTACARPPACAPSPPVSPAASARPARPSRRSATRPRRSSP